MKTLEELLAEWENGTLSVEGAAELKQLLASPEARAELVDDWLVHETIYENLRAERMAQTEADSTTPAPSVGGERRSWRDLLPRFGWGGLQLPWRWAVGAAAALVLACAGFYFYSQSRAVARLVRSEGAMMVVHGGQLRVAGAGTELRSGDVLKVAAGQKAVLGWAGESSTWELDANTELQILSPAPGKRGWLRKGTLRAIMAVQSPKEPVVLFTPHAEVKVNGTRFVLTALDGTTRLEVEQGMADMQPSTPSPGATLQVQAVSNRSCRIEYTDGSHPEVWRVLKDLDAAPTNPLIQLPSPTGKSGTRYRIIAPRPNELLFDAILPEPDDSVTLVFQAVSNRTYVIEYTDAFAPTAWRKLKDIEAAPTNRTIRLPAPASAPRMRFYRLVAPEPSASPAAKGKLGMRTSEPGAGARNGSLATLWDADSSRPSQAGRGILPSFVNTPPPVAQAGHNRSQHPT